MNTAGGWRFQQAMTVNTTKSHSTSGTAITNVPMQIANDGEWFCHSAGIKVMSE